MSLLQKIIKYMKQKNDEVVLNELYDHFPEQKHTTIRGRINETVGKKIIRTGKGRYMLLGAEIEAIVEKECVFDAMPQILKAKIYYDLIFIDPPYKTNGQKSSSGLRDLSPYNTIDPEEFQEIVKQAEKMLRTEDSQLYFMISGGKSSAREANKYIRAFDSTELKLAGEGFYQKLNKDGSVCNMAQYDMPPEKIQVYSPNGKLLKEEETQLEFYLQRPKLARYGGYPTEKPLELCEQIIRQATNKGAMIFDMFGGSGKFLEAALKLGRKIHTMDISDLSIKHMVNKLSKFETKFFYERMLPIYGKSDYESFAAGKLF